MKLKELITETNNILSINFNLNKLKKLYSNDIEYDLELNFDINKYTRNLVYKNDIFQIVIMCWPSKFESSIHNHNKSECLYKIIKGSLEEKIYSINNNKIKLINKIKLNEGHIGNINDNLGIHSVYNMSNKTCISLHLYIPAYTQTEIFEIDENMNYKNKLIDLFFDNI